MTKEKLTKTNIYIPKKKWAIAMLCKGESDILELFINWYKDKAYILIIALHNPSCRLLTYIDDLIKKNFIENIIIKVFNHKDFLQKKWSNEIYREVLQKFDDIDIYAHIDIDEFIYRFDLIEEHYKPDSILKMPWVDIIKGKTDNQLKYSLKPPFEKLSVDDLKHRDKSIYCLGENKYNIIFGAGQHEIFNHSNNELIVTHLDYPIFYHLPYRNITQAYLKISNLLSIFTDMKIPFHETWGTHVFKRFIELINLNMNSVEGGINTFDFSLDLEMLNDFAFPGRHNLTNYYEIDATFVEYFKRYYHENNSFLDFIEIDFQQKIEKYVYSTGSKFNKLS